MCIWYVEYLIVLNITHVILFSCILHIIHLATKQCINTIYPIRTSRGDNEGGDLWEAGDLLSKVLALVKQVSLLFLDQTN